MNIKTKALVVRTVRLGDDRMVVDLLTRQSGRVAVVVRIAQSGKGKMKKQFFQPLTLLDVDINLRPAQPFQSLRDVRLALPYTTIQTSPTKLPIALFVAEFLSYATRDEQLNPNLFDYVEQSLTWLDTATSSHANFHLVFMMRLTKFVGFFPNLESERGELWFDLREGSFTGLRPSHSDFLQPDEAEKIRLLMRMSYDNMRFFRLNRGERNRITSIILHYYRLHVPNFPELKSLDILQSLFD